MRLLLDSHVAVWAIYEPEHLTRHMAELLAELSTELFISHATIWELGNKVAAGRLPLAGTSPERMVGRMEDLGVTFIAITLDEILASSNLPRHHADPFDRLLIAQAQKHGLHLATYDEEIRKYDVLTVWR